MQRLRCFLCLGSVLILGACSASGEDAAQQWVQSRIPAALPETSSALPPILDTPPAAYTAKTVVDPFLPSRIGQSHSVVGSAQGDSTARLHFADAPVDSVRVVGFLEVRGQYVAVLEGRSGFANAKVGDRVGVQPLEILEISAKGIRLQLADGSESWMPISRRGR